MTDRELLEAAAKSAGVLTPSWYGNQAYIDGMLSRWNPLTSDADAFRLAVDLGLALDCAASGCWAWIAGQGSRGVYMEKYKDHDQDKHAATRRAITRAAAALSDERPPPPAT